MQVGAIWRRLTQKLTQDLFSGPQKKKKGMPDNDADEKKGRKLMVQEPQFDLQFLISKADFPKFSPQRNRMKNPAIGATDRLFSTLQRPKDGAQRHLLATIENNQGAIASEHL